MCGMGISVRRTGPAWHRPDTHGLWTAEEGIGGAPELHGVRGYQVTGSVQLHAFTGAGRDRTLTVISAMKNIQIKSIQ